MLELLAAINHRRSVREFLPEPVSHDVLHGLIEAAIQAPSAHNEQAWRFTVITNRSLLADVSMKAKRHALESADETGQIPQFRQMLADPSFDIFYRAPALIVISSPARTHWGVEECAMAAQNLMLAAHAAGLGTCWIGFAQLWLNTPAGRATIDLPPGQETVAPIIVGHPKAAPAATPRKPPDIVWLE